MLLISFWQVLVFLIAFFIIKTSQEWGRIVYNPWQSKIKLKYIKNPSFGELRSLCQINQVCKEENQRRNLTSNDFAWLCKIFAKYAKCPKGVQAARQRARLWKINFTPCAKFHKPCKIEENEFRTLCEISWTLRKSSYVIFRYFCTDSVRFLSWNILCNYLFSPWIS